MDKALSNYFRENARNQFGLQISNSLTDLGIFGTFRHSKICFYSKGLFSVK